MRAHASASSPPALLSLQSEHGARRFGAGMLLNRACDRRGEVMRTLVMIEHLEQIQAQTGCTRGEALTAACHIISKERRA